MKRQWVLPPGVDLESVVVCFGFAWFLGGMIAFVVGNSESHRHHGEHGLTSVGLIALLAWIMPYVLSGLGWALARGYRHRPRRVWVPVKEDLRSQK